MAPVKRALAGEVGRSLRAQTGLEIFGTNGLQARIATVVNGAAPTKGTWRKGDVAIDLAGGFWLCTVRGTPGTWVSLGGSSTTLQVGSGGTPISGAVQLANGNGIAMTEAGQVITVNARSPRQLFGDLCTVSALPTGVTTSGTVTFDSAALARILGDGGTAAASYITPTFSFAKAIWMEAIYTIYNSTGTQPIEFDVLRSGSTFGQIVHQSDGNIVAYNPSGAAVAATGAATDGVGFTFRTALGFSYGNPGTPPGNRRFYYSLTGPQNEWKGASGGANILDAGVNLMGFSGVSTVSSVSYADGDSFGFQIRLPAGSARQLILWGVHIFQGPILGF